MKSGGKKEKGRKLKVRYSEKYRKKYTEKEGIK
jgi:hypothetical protein